MVTFHEYIVKHQISHSAEEIDCSNARLTDLNGIEQFKQLRRLYLAGNQVTSLDLRQNLLLEVCECSVYYYDAIINNTPVRSNPIKMLSIRGLKRLRVLYAANADLHDIDLTGCTALEEVMINRNRLSSLILKNHPHLLRLICSYNLLKELRIENSPNLQILRCNDNRLPENNIRRLVEQFPKIRQFWKNRQQPKSQAGRPALKKGKHTPAQIMRRHRERTRKRRYEVSVTEEHLKKFMEMEKRTRLSRADLVEWVLDQAQKSMI